MKILAIRGKNLASLSAEFEVDYQSEPLASAGLYAITGPTGSGKSTLLDALCLALYERTPRLQKATAKGETIPDVGTATVAPSDPRTILRRGASECFAEVDFVGSDSVAYRARWSARRARTKADGKLQASDITLVRIADGQCLGDHTKTETLRLIEACIGLSFEQFTRAVLLAQNDFATFLKAPDDERAELLQTLTGTETFSQISRQAYARMKAENEALLRLQAQLQDQLPLQPEVRAEKEAALQAQSAHAQELEAHKASIEGHQRWHQQHAQHEDALAQAQAQHTAALAAQADAQPRQAQLELLEQVQDARPLWAEQERLAHALVVATQAHMLSGTQLAEAQQQTALCQSASDAAQEQATLAERAKTNAQADMDQARTLDASIQAVEPEFQSAAQATEQAQAHLEAQSQQQTQSLAHRTEAQTALQNVDAWLDQHAGLRALSEGWQGWELLLASAHAALNSQTQSQAQAAALALQSSSHAQQLAAAQATLQRATAQSDAALAQLDLQVQACAATDAEALAHGKQALETQRDHLQAAALLWHQRSALRAQRIRLQEQLQAHSATLEESEGVLQEAAQREPELRAALQSAEQALHLAQLAASQSAEDLRAQLQPEQPCPVCGGRDHPYADHAPVRNAMLDSLQTHAGQRQQALQEVLARSAFATANRASAAKALEQGSRELTQLAAQRDALLQEWAALALQSALDAVPETERSTWLQQHQEQARLALVQLGMQEAQHRQNLQHKDVAQLALTVAQQTLVQAREALAQLDSKATQIRQQQDYNQQQITVQTQQLDAALAQLDAAFGAASWQDAWRADPHAFVAQCRSDAQAWSAQHSSQVRLTQRLAQLQLQLSAADSACAQATLQRDTQSQRFTLVQTQLHDYRAQRAKLLQGRPVAQWESSLNTAIAHAKASHGIAQTKLHDVRAEATRLQETLRLSTQQMEQLQTDATQAQAALAQWLQSHCAQQRGAAPDGPLTLDVLQQLLAMEPAHLARERQALQTLQSAVTTALAVRDTRAQSLAAHAQARATPDSAAALQDQLLACNAQRAALAATLSALQLDIARDDERLSASRTLRGQIAQQTAQARVWSQLGELIGSADGKKFRNFAQQYTLDILLGYGNRHLQTLSKRYRLERIQDSLGLLVVDQDMGDEVRSVHSLSGGESFLVSLAMALGLASLSSHRVRVESLFIDEGFGSLDADSLRVAMDALDSLQSLGRKVGVISHVQEMTERIGTRVQVQRMAGGLSRIVVGSAA